MRRSNMQCVVGGSHRQTAVGTNKVTIEYTAFTTKWVFLISPKAVEKFSINELDAHKAVSDLPQKTEMTT